MRYSESSKFFLAGFMFLNKLVDLKLVLRDIFIETLGSGVSQGLGREQ